MFSILLALAAVGAPPGEAVIGRWRTTSRNGVVQIDHCGSSVCGRLVTSDGIRENPALADTKNKNAALRNRPLRNMPMLSGFTRDGEAWSGGTIYNPEDGKTYSARLTPEGTNQLRVRGCVFVPLCKTQVWTRLP